MFKRNPLKFLFFSDKLRFWYFKYIIGAVLITLTLAGLSVYATISVYAKMITLQGLQLPGATNPPINLARDMLLNAQGEIVSILILEGIFLLIIGIVISMYFAYRLMGPVTRIEKEVKQMIEGLAEMHPITLRDGDYLLPVVEVMNRLIEVIGRKQETIEDFRSALKGFQHFVRSEKTNV